MSATVRLCGPTAAPIGKGVGGCGRPLVPIPGGAGGYVCVYCDGAVVALRVMKGPHA